MPADLGLLHTTMIQPARVLSGQYSLPHACPFDSLARHPFELAYLIASSISLLGVFGYAHQYGRELTSVNTEERRAPQPWASVCETKAKNGFEISGWITGYR